MNIIEQSTIGKRGSAELNEDALFVGRAYAAVVDGVTSKSVANLWRPSPGVAARTAIVGALAWLDGAAPDATMRETQHAIDAALLAQYGPRDPAGAGAVSQSPFIDAQAAAAHHANAAFFDAHPLERLQANAVVYSAHEHRIWLFGDCQAMVNGQAVDTVKRVDVLLGDLRSFVWQAMQLGAAAGADASVNVSAGTDANGSAAPGADPSRDAIMPFLRMQSRFANQRGEYGYFVFDGYTDPTYPIRTVAVSPGDEVVLASDGYPLLAPSLAASEAKLARLRAEDPHLVSRYKTTKGFSPDLLSFDDRTYLRFVA